MTYDHINQHISVESRREFERLLRIGLTHAQYRKLQKQERYLLTLFEKIGIVGLSKEEKEKLQEILKTQSKLIWDALYSRTLVEAEETYPALSEEKIIKYAFNRAESLMLELLHLPPHFTKMGECRSCGVVALPETQIDLKPLSCPWCTVVRIKKDFFINGEKHYEQ